MFDRHNGFMDKKFKRTFALPNEVRKTLTGHSQRKENKFEIQSNSMGPR